MTQFSWHENVSLNRQSLSRRGFLYGVSASAVAAGTMNFRDVMTLRADELRKQGKAMILLFMQGGPSQLETFDPKPGTEHGGPTSAISTAVSGIQIAEGWEHTAKQMQDIAIIRSMTNKEGEHQRAVYQMHTGYIPSGSVKHPSLGACIAKELAPPTNLDLPSVVSQSETAVSNGMGVPAFWESTTNRSASPVPASEMFPKTWRPPSEINDSIDVWVCSTSWKVNSRLAAAKPLCTITVRSMTSPRSWCFLH